MARRSPVCGICSTANLPSVCPTCINYRLLERYKLVQNLAQERDMLRRRLDEELIAKREAELQQHWRVEHSERKEQLAEKLRQCKEELAQAKVKQEQLRHEAEARDRTFSATAAQLEKKKTELLARYYPDMIRAQSLVLTSVASEMYQKRRAVFKQLCKILPLRRSTVSGEERQSFEGSLNNQLCVKICGARLPTGDDPLSTPHTELAASLGYLVQLVNMSARYLSGPLLHSSGFAASSSRVWQRASYYDSRPASRSEEFPLFLPRQNGRGASGDESYEMSKSVGSNLGFSSLESPRVDNLESTATMVNFAAASSGTRESYPDVQKGIRHLRRSVGCLCAYAFGQLSLNVPPDMAIFDAFAELLHLLSSKEMRSRSSRRNQQPNGRFGLSEGPLARMRTGLPTLSEGNRFAPESLDQKGKVTSWNNEEYEYNSDSEQGEAASNVTDSTVDGWNLVEHPTLPPPPSHSEDVEHWTRAMFIDATK